MTLPQRYILYHMLLHALESPASLTLSSFGIRSRDVYIAPYPPLLPVLGHRTSAPHWMPKVLAGQARDFESNQVDSLK